MSDRQANILAALVVALSDSFNDAGIELNQHGSRSAALTTIFANPGMRVDELATVLALTGSGAVRLVNTLCDQQLVARGRHKTDGRAVALSTTTQGDELSERILQTRHSVAGQALEVLSSDEREYLLNLLEKMLASVTRDRVTADRICRYCDYAACPQLSCPVEQAVS